MDQRTEDMAHLCAAHGYAQRLSRCERLKVGCVVVTVDESIIIGVNGMPIGASNCCEDEHGNSKPEVQQQKQGRIV